jgi:hypothetical protein
MYQLYQLYQLYQIYQMYQTKQNCEKIVVTKFLASMLSQENGHAML